MENKRDKLVAVARSYVGYLEKASDSRLEDFAANAGAGNWTIFGKWYGLNGQPWCAMFVSFCAALSGIPEGVMPKHASCSAGVAWFRKAGRWKERSSGYVPRPGDIVYFTRDGKKPVHVGIVTRTGDGRVYTVEGNTSRGNGLVENGGCVAEKSYPMNSACILGYGAPEYSGKGGADVTVDEIRRELTKVEGTGGGHSPWAKEAVGALVGAGVVRGDGAGNFGWGQCLTREGAAVMLYSLLARLGLLERLKGGDGEWNGPS